MGSAGGWDGICGMAWPQPVTPVLAAEVGTVTLLGVGGVAPKLHPRPSSNLSPVTLLPILNTLIPFLLAPIPENEGARGDQLHRAGQAHGLSPGVPG